MRKQIRELLLCILLMYSVGADQNLSETTAANLDDGIYEISLEKNKVHVFGSGAESTVVNRSLRDQFSSLAIHGNASENSGNATNFLDDLYNHVIHLYNKSSFLDEIAKIRNASSQPTVMILCGGQSCFKVTFLTVQQANTSIFVQLDDDGFEIPLARNKPGFTSDAETTAVGDLFRDLLSNLLNREDNINRTRGNETGDSGTFDDLFDFFNDSIIENLYYKSRDVDELARKQPTSSQPTVMVICGGQSCFKATFVTAEQVNESEDPVFLQLDGDGKEIRLNKRKLPVFARNSSVFYKSFESKFRNLAESEVLNESTSKRSGPFVAPGRQSVKLTNCSYTWCPKNRFLGSFFCKVSKQKKIDCFAIFGESNETVGTKYTYDGLSFNIKRKESPIQLKSTTCNIRVTADSSFHYLQGGNRQNVESELIMIFDEVNKILGLADFDFDGEPDGFSLTVQDIIVKEADNNTATGYDAKFDALGLSKVFQDFRNERQGSCASLLFVSIPMESNLIFTTYGAGVCQNNLNEVEPAFNVALINVVDRDGHTRPRWETAYFVANAVTNLMGSAEKGCQAMMPLPPDQDWNGIFTDCGLGNMVNTLSRRGHCLEVQNNKTTKSTTVKTTEVSSTTSKRTNTTDKSPSTTTKTTETTPKSPSTTTKTTETTPKSPSTATKTTETTPESPSTAIKATKTISKSKEKVLLANKEISNSSCGNNRVDKGEECDCGTPDRCSKIRSCCIPPGKKNECMYDRSKGYECEWTESCCTKCKVVPKDWNHFCGFGDPSCAPKASFCDGKSSHCPVHPMATNLNNGEMCGPVSLKHLGQATCSGGRCNSTACRDNDFEDCECAAGTGHQCRVCCKSSQNVDSDTGERLCVPIEYFRSVRPPTRTKDEILFRRLGTPCNEVRFGHCDKAGKCVKPPNMSSSAVRQCLYQRLEHIVAISVIFIFSFFIFSEELAVSA